MMDLPEIIVLNDPELAMADDHLPPVERIVAVGNWQRDYPSMVALIADRDRLEIELDKYVTDKQKAIEPEAWVIRRFVPEEGPEATIYGHLLTADQSAEREGAHGADEPEIGRWRARVANAHDRGWLFGKFYSRLVPEGETGVIHRAMISATIGEDVFLTAGQRGWPTLKFEDGEVTDVRPGE